jgi:hypothetical protein
MSNIIKSRRTLANINDTFKIDGEEFSHFKAESQIMYALASNIESLVHISYRRFFSVRKSVIYEMGTQTMLLPYLNLIIPDLDINARTLLANRYKDIHGQNPTLESLTSILDTGKRYLQMQSFCKNNANSIYIHELSAPSSQSVQAVAEQLFCGNPIMVHTEMPEFMHALVEYVVSRRKDVSIDTVVDVDNGYMINTNQAIYVAGDDAKKYFSQYVAAIKDRAFIEGTSYSRAPKERLPSTTLKSWAVPDAAQDKDAEEEFERKPTDVSYPPPFPIIPDSISNTAGLPNKGKK